MQLGKAVVVPFSLPIIFNAQDVLESNQILRFDLACKKYKKVLLIINQSCIQNCY